MRPFHPTVVRGFYWRINNHPHLRISLHTSLQGGDESELKGEKNKAVNSQVSPHDNEEVAPFRHLRLEEFGVSDGLFRRVNRAGANDNNKSVIVSGQDSSAIVASGSDSLLGGRRGDDFMAKQGRLDEGVIL